MVKKSPSKSSASRPLKNQRREKISFAQVLSSANRRAHEQANHRGGKRAEKFVWAAVAASEMDGGAESAEWGKRVMRWSLASLLLPVCWVTMWTFLSRFSEATADPASWRTPEFWYFATGALVMIGWFWSGLFQSFFLYLYVLGHELTHAIFVLLYRGKVTEFHVSANGGYITTNKTNLVIALSPYFVPFWAIVAAAFYGSLRHFAGLSAEWDRALYALLGLTWTFHMVWTLWMIPRDQPDLKENGTYLSLVVIYLANLLVLAGLLCVARGSPLENSWGFATDWIRNAATAGDMILRWGHGLVVDFRAAAKL